MLKLKIHWELETGEVYEEWTRPNELAQAEKELYNNKSIIKILTDESSPSNNFLLFLAHKIQQRVTKKIENIESWKSKVTDIAAVDFETANFTKPEASGE
jgi:formate dehydrogenase maturation protein FdhE